MQFGVCGNADVAAIAARALYDYAEGTVEAVLKPRETEDVFRAALEKVRAALLPYPVVCGFVPGDLKITGHEVDRSALETFVTTTMRRAARASVRSVVFGSGAARHIPAGFDPRVAHEQLVWFCSMAAPLAFDHGVTVVVEPLNRGDCNILTTVDECARLVREVDHPAIRLLVDAFHLMVEGDSYESIVAHGDLLSHVHIATRQNRLAPGAEPCDLAPFFRALSQARYDGTISIEAHLSSPETELTAALTVMRAMAGQIG